MKKRFSVDLSAAVFALCAALLLTHTARAEGEPPPVTFTHDVAPIIYEKCALCHHPDEAAPFSLLSYEDVRKRARQIVELTQKRFMPPWLPEPGEGDFLGTRRLSDRELQTIKDWVSSGANRGADADLPPAPVFTEGWQTGEPDLVLESPEYKLSAEGKDVFRNFVVSVPLSTPRWIQSIELRAENPRVTHHARLGVDSSNESVRRDAEDPEPGYAGMAWAQDPDGQLVIWAPGMVSAPGAPGVAWRLYPKTSLVLHTHMQPSGKPETVKFKIGIHFANRPPDVYPMMMRIGSCNIDIPAGATHQAISDEYTLPIDVEVRSVFPHAHSLCKELHVVAVLPDGSQRPLISINHFDENWHDLYRYREPLRLPRGTRLVSTFIYDNSDTNVRNRNHPARRVVYGSNVTDEMADVYLQVTAAHPDQRAVLMEHYKQYELQSQAMGYRKALEMFPDDHFSMEGLATCYVGIGKAKDAQAVLEQRLKIPPREVYPFVSYGMALFASGDLEQAEKHLRQAIAMDSEYPLAWLGLGKVLNGEKKIASAEEAYRRAMELAPEFVDSELELADLLVRRGQLDEAAHLCTSALANSPSSASIYLKLGEICARQKKYDQSLDYFTQARQAAPYTHPAKVILAIFCLGNNETDRGMQLISEAQVEFPDYPMVPLVLGQLASREHQFDHARDLFTKAALLPIPDNWPESHKRRFGILLHSEQFRLAQQLQDLKLARESLAEWIKFDPENSKLQKMMDELNAIKPK